MAHGSASLEDFLDTEVKVPDLESRDLGIDAISTLPQLLFFHFCLWQLLQEIPIQFLGWEDPLEEGETTHSSILAWRIPMDRGARWATRGHKESDIDQLSTSQGAEFLKVTH